MNNQPTRQQSQIEDSVSGSTLLRYISIENILLQDSLRIFIRSEIQ